LYLNPDSALGIDALPQAALPVRTMRTGAPYCEDARIAESPASCPQAGPTRLSTPPIAAPRRALPGPTGPAKKPCHPRVI
jgi:hypothetical protein